MAGMWSAVAKMTVPEGLAHVKNHVGKEFAPSTFPARYAAWYKNYKAKYIDTSSPEPLAHTTVLVGCMAYVCGWAAEKRHMKHEQDHG